MVDYSHFFQSSIKLAHQEGRYRNFHNITRICGEFPYANWLTPKGELKKIINWCSNDYLGLGQNSQLITSMLETVKAHGAGSGGTRNISGTNKFHIELEKDLAEFHHKQSALVFSTGYVSNEATLSSLAKILPSLAIFSDKENHASMIAGIRNSGAEKYVFRHNDPEHLCYLLKKICIHRPKLIAFESVYSMDGDFGLIAEFIKIAKKYKALTYLDEVHGVGLYGKTGAGLACSLGLDQEIDIIEGTMGKAFGLFGGYICANKEIIETIRLNARGFIFTTSLPPAIVAAASKAIEVLKTSNHLRIKQKEQVYKVKAGLRQAGINFINTPSHIIPLIIGNDKLCQKISNLLLHEYNIYLQPINAPTVAKGSERLRITAGPLHSDKEIKHLVNALKLCFQRCDYKQEKQNYKASTKL